MFVVNSLRTGLFQPILLASGSLLNGLPVLDFGRFLAGISMNSALPSRDTVRFELFEVQRSTGRLFKSGIRLKLPPQPFRLLLLLIDNRGRVVSREEIQRHLWREATWVDFEHGINYSVNQIRTVLGDDPDHPRFVETLPRIGYRFIADLQGYPGQMPTPSDRVFAMPTDHSHATLRDIETESVLPSTAAPTVARSTTKRLVITVAVIGLLSIAGFVTLHFRSRSTHSGEISFENLQLVKLPDTGMVKNIAISGDGRYVAYVRVIGEEQALHLRQTTGGGDVQVLPPALGNFVAVTFSPDGNSVYFVRADPKHMGFRYLFQVPTLGGVPQKLVSDVDSGVAFSPDGRRISYQRWFAHQNEGELKIANADGSAERSLFRIRNLNPQSPGDPAPDWSPDGRTIVLSKLLLQKQRRWVIYAVSVENGSPQELYSTDNPIGRPIWLRSGKGLLVSQYDPVSHRSQLWTISYPQGVARRFTHDISDYSMDLDYTRDGRTVVSIASAVYSHIWKASSAEPYNAQQITSGDHPFFLSKLTADGKILSTDAYGTLWTMNPDGTQAMVLGNMRDVDWFSVCGNYAVAAAHENNLTTVVRLDLNSSHTMTLTGGNLWSPSCSRQGRTVYYANLDMPQKIWRVPLEGGDPAEVAPIQGDTIMGNLSVSPDGRFLAYQSNFWSASPPSRQVTVIPANGGPLVATFDTKAENWMVGPYWTPDSKAIQYLRVENQISNIWEQPLAGGSPKKLTHFTSGHIADFAWSEDRSRLFFTRDIETADVVLLTNLH